MTTLKQCFREAMNVIGFEAGSNWYEAGSELHHFRGYIDDKPVRCVISQITIAALGDDRLRRGTPSDLFDAIEHRVFALAEQKARLSGCDRHGVIAINSGDTGLCTERMAKKRLRDRLSAS